LDPLARHPEYGSGIMSGWNGGHERGLGDTYAVAPLQRADRSRSN
jgi:hypothetical protein